MTPTQLLFPANMKDRFVPKTYLKRFGGPPEAGMLHAYSKLKGTRFRCWPTDVCSEPDGDLSSFLSKPDLLADFHGGAGHIAAWDFM